MNNYIETFTGKVFDFNKQDADSIDIVDIAHALSNQNRYGGHTRYPYSIAAHSSMVALLIHDQGYSPDIIAAGLLHDAAEAYMGDMVSPLKSMFPRFREIELQILRKIHSVFGLPEELCYSSVVHTADRVALAIEVKRLGLIRSRGDPNIWGAWIKDIDVDSFDIPDWLWEPSNPMKDRELFLKCFNLYIEKGA